MVLADTLSEGGDGGIEEEVLQGKFNGKDLADSRCHASDQQGVTAKVEKVSMDADLIQFEDVTPNSGQLSFDMVARPGKGGFRILSSGSRQRRAVQFPAGRPR